MVVRVALEGRGWRVEVTKEAIWGQTRSWRVEHRITAIEGDLVDAMVVLTYV